LLMEYLNKIIKRGGVGFVITYIAFYTFGHNAHV
jgi:hypothetical protein